MLLCEIATPQPFRFRHDQLRAQFDSASEIETPPGDVIGLVSLLANPPAYMVSAKTVSECEFMVWDHATIRRLAKAYPLLNENGLRLALHYLNAYMNRHVSIISKSAELRLAEALVHLATEAGEVQPAEWK